MTFDGEAFVTRFNTVWNGHDLDGIMAMMLKSKSKVSSGLARVAEAGLLEPAPEEPVLTDDVVFGASFGKEPWGTRAVGRAAGPLPRGPHPPRRTRRCPARRYPQGLPRPRHDDLLAHPR